MGLRETDELIARAADAAANSGLAPQDRAASTETGSLDAILGRLEHSPRPWEIHEGMRMRGLRRVLLRILAPFVERQEQVNGDLRVAVVLLGDELARLRSEVAAGDARADSSRSESS